MAITPPSTRPGFSLWRHRHLVASLTWREVQGRYRGSAGGLLWSLITPILMLSVYTAVFSGIFQARWSQEASTPLDYALQLFVGLIVHGLAAECLTRSPGLMLANVSYVKRVVFPLETLPVVTLLSSLFHALISLVVLLVFFMLVKQSIPTQVWWLPLVWLPYLAMLAGASWFLAGLGVYLRDIHQLMGLVTLLLMFLSPVFYPASALPPTLQGFFQLNPLTIIIEQSRNVLLNNTPPDLIALGIYSAVAAVVAITGYRLFHKMKKGFADVL